MMHMVFISGGVFKVAIERWSCKISKHKDNFAKGHIQNWYEEVFVITKIKNAVPWAYVITGLNGEESIIVSWKRTAKELIEIEFRIEKVIKKKRCKLYVK